MDRGGDGGREPWADGDAPAAASPDGAPTTWWVPPPPPPPPWAWAAPPAAPGPGGPGAPGPGGSGRSRPPRSGRDRAAAVLVALVLVVVAVGGAVALWPDGGVPTDEAAADETAAGAEDDGPAPTVPGAGGSGPTTAPPGEGEDPGGLISPSTTLPEGLTGPTKPERPDDGPRPDHWPSPSPERSPTPLGQPPVVPEAGSYAFWEHHLDGRPVAFDPCVPIRYVVNGRTAPPGADTLLAEAVAIVSEATGLRFVHEGATDEGLPSAPPRPAWSDRYGDRWSPVLVAWTDPAENPDLGGDIVGWARSVPMSVPNTAQRVYVTGDVALDGPEAAAILADPGGAEWVRGLIVHELGHLLGLDHVVDLGEVMHEDGDGANVLGPGDRYGLAQLGRGPCAPDI